MSSTIETKPRFEAPSECSDPPPSPDEFSARQFLSPHLSEALAIDARQLFAVIWVAGTFLVSNYLPLPSGPLWGDIAYGNALRHGASLDEQDPFVAFVEGVPHVATNSLSQRLLSLLSEFSNPEVYSHVTAILTCLSASLMLLSFWWRSRSLGVSLAALLLLTTLSVVTPRIAGAADLGWLMLSVSFVLFANFERHLLSEKNSLVSKRVLIEVIATAILFSVWANLHVSFLFGLIFVGAMALGTAIDQTIASRSPASIWRNRECLGWILLADAAILGALCNPAGMDLLLQEFGLLRFFDLGNGLDAAPVVANTWSALPIAVMGFLAMLLLRLSRQPLRTADGLMTAGLFLMASFNVHSLVWTLPVLTYVFLPHLADVTERWISKTAVPLIQPAYHLFHQKSFHLSLIAGLVVWVAFTLSPMSRLVMGGKGRTPEQYLRGDIPLAATNELIEHPPQGILATTSEWSDWLISQGPPELKVLSTSQTERFAPLQLRRDTVALMQGRGDTHHLLERYRIHAVLVDLNSSPRLYEELKELKAWRRSYEDPQAALFVRSLEPIDDDETGVSDLDENASPEDGHEVSE
ncbi:MAG: hypothetical protein KDA80_23335 [Planctomycetaceae bacterium]|nr:hypothetical protein [Planctomycetaceae bacterium]